jgi:para-nitrobenzyl esterase
MKSNTRHALAGLLLAAATATLAAAAAAAPVPKGSAPGVQLAQGALVGTTQRGARAFLGIPFAQPPVGALRWRAPMPAKGWRGTRDASRFGANCMQGPPVPFGPWTAEFLIDASMDEDCLYLNVWSPAPPAAQPLPVLVWIHGGGFGSGSGSIPIYNGATLASRGIVVVTINYRIGIFGFFAHPELAAESPQHVSGNYGLLDIIESLRWVQANIARFGGDPARVTIAGQSAGAAAVHDLVASPLAHGLFVRGIAQSGSGMGLASSTLAEAQAQGAAVQRAAGAASLAALRAMSAAQVQAVQQSPAAPQAGAAVLRFGPLIDAYVLTGDAGQGAGTIANAVPMLTGFNADEARSMGPLQVKVEDFESMVRARYGELAARLLALYPHADDSQAAESFFLLARDRYMVAQTLWSIARTRARGEAVWGYLFDHVLPGPDAARFRSFHTAEVPYVFGVLDQGARGYTDADRAVSAQLQGYWLNFIRNGDPNGPGLARWERFAEASGKVMELGDHPGPAWPASSGERYQALRDYAAAGGQLSLF